MKKLRNEDNVSSELAQMYVEASEISSQKPIGIIQLVKSKTYRLPLLCGILLTLAQQYSGINTVSFGLTIVYI